MLLFKLSSITIERGRFYSLGCWWSGHCFIKLTLKFATMVHQFMSQLEKLISIGEKERFKFFYNWSNIYFWAELFLSLLNKGVDVLMFIIICEQYSDRVSLVWLWDKFKCYWLCRALFCLVVTWWVGNLFVQDQNKHCRASEWVKLRMTQHLLGIFHITSHYIDWWFLLTDTSLCSIIHHGLSWVDT